MDIMANGAHLFLKLCFVREKIKAPTVISISICFRISTVSSNINKYKIYFEGVRVLYESFFADDDWRGS